MPAHPEPSSARATSRTEDRLFTVDLAGPWRLDQDTPRWSATLGAAVPAQVRLRADGVTHWDTSLVAFLGEAPRWCAEAGIACDVSLLPEKMRRLSSQFEGSMQIPPASSAAGPGSAGATA